MPLPPSPNITLLGLGPGDPGLLTRQTWELLQSASEIYLRTRQHPVVESFPDTLTVHSFDHLYETGESFEQVYAQIVERILKLGRRPEGVIYAVPGHPFVAETTAPEIYRRARQEGIPIRTLAGVSFLESVFIALEIDPFPHTVLVDAFELATAHYPPFPSDAPALIAQIHSREMAAEVKLTLTALYPDEHPVQLVHAAGAPGEKVESLSLYEIDRSPHIGLLTSLYLPPLGPQTSVEALQEVIAHLRAPDGCPWDREQTYLSLRSYLMEETFEVLDAIDAEDLDAMAEELGDLMLQILLQVQIASETGDFTMVDVMQSINNKLIRRHPHVFGDVEVDGAASVAVNWDRIKAEERKETKGGKKSPLDGVPLSLPALAQSNAYQQRAARAGFDWPSVEEVFEKIVEKLSEIRATPGDESRARETRGEQSRSIGDLLFAVVCLAGKLDVDPEATLREANGRFRARFTYIENIAHQQGRELKDFSLEELNVLWERARGED